MSEQANRKISPPGGAAEPELIVRARAGDSEAFASLYNEHQPIVYRYLFFRLRNRHLAEDLTQEVFVRALRRMDTFTWQGTGFGGWLATIAKNIHLDYVKSGRARLEFLTDEFYDAEDRDRSAETSALRELEAVEAHEAVHGAMQGLNPHQRQCVRLRFLEELSTEEAAQEMGQTVGAVKTLTYRAMQNLKQELRQAEGAAA